VNVDVGGSSGVFDLSGVGFEFSPLASVLSVSPSSGSTSGVGVVYVSGSEFRASGLLCRFGSASPSSGLFVSSVLVQCEASAHVEGVASFEVSLGDDTVQYSTSGITFEYSSPPNVYGVSPVEGEADREKLSA